MHTLIQVHDFSEGLASSFRQHLAANSPARYLQGSSLRFDLHYTLDSEADANPNLSFVSQLLEENFSARVFVDASDPHLDWFRMGEKLGVLKLTVIPGLSLSTLAAQVYQLINEAVSQRKIGAELYEVRIFNHRNIVSYTPTQLGSDA